MLYHYTLNISGFWIIWKSDGNLSQISDILYTERFINYIICFYRQSSDSGVQHIICNLHTHKTGE